MHASDGHTQNNRSISGEEQRLTGRPTASDNSTGISGLREATTTANPGPITLTVNSLAQTDNADTFVVSKDTLIAYTIVVIQQTQDYHFGQMSIVFQTAHNKSALETLSRAQELASEHFNIALLTDKTRSDSSPHAEANTSLPTVDPTSTSSTQETVPKTVEQHFKHPNSKSQPTGIVPPTCQPDPGVFDGIPAGYETDDSWGCYSPHADPEEQTPDVEEELLPFLTLRAWRQNPQRGTLRGRPRGRGGINNHRQHNQSIPVRDGYVQPPRPWESRPYGRRTRSQRALQE